MNTKNQLIMGLDVGSTHTGYAIIAEVGKLYKDPSGVETFGKIPNEDVLTLVRGWGNDCMYAIEYPYPKNNVVAFEVFQMTEWVGRIMQRIDDGGGKYARIFRHREKSVMCKSGVANDAQIRAAVISIYGGKGTKKNQGPTYGVTADVWQAIAVATTYAMEGDSLERDKFIKSQKKIVIPKKIVV